MFNSLSIITKDLQLSTQDGVQINLQQLLNYYGRKDQKRVEEEKEEKDKENSLKRQWVVGNSTERLKKLKDIQDQQLKQCGITFQSNQRDITKFKGKEKGQKQREPLEFLFGRCWMQDQLNHKN